MALVSPATGSSDQGEVTFKELLERYGTGQDISVVYELGGNFSPSSRDWVGLYKAGTSNPAQYLAFEWAPVKPSTSEGQDESSAATRLRKVAFLARYIHVPGSTTQFYQFLYVAGGGQVKGFSSRFIICDHPHYSPTPSDTADNLAHSSDSLEDYELIPELILPEGFEDRPISPLQLSEPTRRLHDHNSLCGSFAKLTDGLDILKIMEILDQQEGLLAKPVIEQQDGRHTGRAQAWADPPKPEDQMRPGPSAVNQDYVVAIERPENGTAAMAKDKPEAKERPKPEAKERPRPEAKGRPKPEENGTAAMAKERPVPKEKPVPKERPKPEAKDISKPEAKERSKPKAKERPMPEPRTKDGVKRTDIEAKTAAVNKADAQEQTADVKKADAQAETADVNKADRQMQTCVNKADAQAQTEDVNKADTQMQTSVNMADEQAQTDVYKADGQMQTAVNKSDGGTQTAAVNKADGQMQTAAVNKADGQAQTDVIKADGGTQTAVNKANGQMQTAVNNVVGQAQTDVNNNIPQGLVPYCGVGSLEPVYNPFWQSHLIHERLKSLPVPFVVPTAQGGLKLRCQACHRRKQEVRQLREKAGASASKYSQLRREFSGMRASLDTKSALLQKLSDQIKHLVHENTSLSITHQKLLESKNKMADIARNNQRLEFEMKLCECKGERLQAENLALHKRKEGLIENLEREERERQRVGTEREDLERELKSVSQQYKELERHLDDVMYTLSLQGYTSLVDTRGRAIDLTKVTGNLVDLEGWNVAATRKTEKCLQRVKVQEEEKQRLKETVDRLLKQNGGLIGELQARDVTIGELGERVQGLSEMTERLKGDLSELEGKLRDAQRVGEQSREALLRERKNTSVLLRDHQDKVNELEVRLLSLQDCVENRNLTKKTPTRQKSVTTTTAPCGPPAPGPSAAARVPKQPQVGGNRKYKQPTNPTKPAEPKPARGAAIHKQPTDARPKRKQKENPRGNPQTKYGVMKPEPKQPRRQQTPPTVTFDKVNEVVPFYDQMPDERQKEPASAPISGMRNNTPYYYEKKSDERQEKPTGAATSNKFIDVAPLYVKLPDEKIKEPTGATASSKVSEVVPCPGKKSDERKNKPMAALTSGKFNDETDLAIWSDKGDVSGSDSSETTDTAKQGGSGKKPSGAGCRFVFEYYSRGKRRGRVSTEETKREHPGKAVQINNLSCYHCGLTFLPGTDPDYIQSHIDSHTRTGY